MQALACLGRAEIDEIKLHIGPRDFGPGARECAGVSRAYRQRAAARKQIFQSDSKCAPPARHVVVEGDRPGAAPDGAHVEVILQVFADRGQLGDERQTMRFEQLARGHARELQQLRRIERARGEQHFARRARLPQRAAAAVLHAHAARSREQDPRCERTGNDRQVGAALGGAKEAGCRARAPAIPGCRLIVSCAFLRRAVEIVVARNADLAGGGDERIAQLMPVG